jgi:FxsC-like protein
MQAVSAAQLPPSEKDFDFNNLPNAFAPGTMELSLPVPRQSGAAHALVVIAAGNESDMRSIRTELSSYGQGWLNWRPFPPPSLDTAVVAAQTVLAGEGLASTPIAFDDMLIERIGESPEDDIFLIFLDPWSVSLPKFKERLKWLDKHRFLGAVLKVWSKDSETETNGDEIRTCVQAALPLLTATGTAISLFDVPADHERFSQQLAELIANMQSRMFATRQDQRRVQEQVKQVAAPPLIQGPTG